MISEKLTDFTYFMLHKLEEEGKGQNQNNFQDETLKFILLDLFQGIQSSFLMMRMSVSRTFKIISWKNHTFFSWQRHAFSWHKYWKRYAVGGCNCAYFWGKSGFVLAKEWFCGKDTLCLGIDTFLSNVPVH